jgi:hypothetical protein
MTRIWSGERTRPRVPQPHAPKFGMRLPDVRAHQALKFNACIRRER